MMILSLVRNYMPAHKQICDGDWNVAEIARKYVPLPFHILWRSMQSVTLSCHFGYMGLSHGFCHMTCMFYLLCHAPYFVVALQLCICHLSFACWHVENATKATAVELHAQRGLMQRSHGQIHRCHVPSKMAAGHSMPLLHDMLCGASLCLVLQRMDLLAHTH